MGFSKIISSKLLKRNAKYILKRTFLNSPKKPPWKVLFFGADNFSIFSLEALTKEYRKGKLINQLEVVTTLKGKPNVVRVYSEQENINIHKWPPNLNYGQFDVGLVVSFGHLIPENIIKKFEFGMLNVHASLLPRWRGAAPIIYAIANGDKQTGITIMRISPKKFDIGEIVCQESVKIDPHMKMSDLYTTLGSIGAKNLIQTLNSLNVSLYEAKPQPTEGVTYAPKVSYNLASIKWDKMTSNQIFNLARALEGVYSLHTSWQGIPIKLIDINLIENFENLTSKEHPGFVIYDKLQNSLKILCLDNKFITVKKIGVHGKKLMDSKDFANGYLKKEPPDRWYFK